MKKKQCIAGMLAVAMTAMMMSGCGQTQTAAPQAETQEETQTEVSEVKVNATVTMHAGNYDDGACVDHLILKADAPIDSIDNGAFEIMETQYGLNYMTMQNELSTNPRTITGVYLCDEQGNKVGGPSEFVRVDLFAITGSGKLFESALVGTQSLNVWAGQYKLEINLTEGTELSSNGAKVTAFNVNSESPELDLTGDVTKFDYTKSFAASDGITLNYATYEPETATGTLLVWLHGLGEGGTENTDPRVPLLAAEASVMASEKFQTAVGGANILVPQCPTWWMDPDGTAQVLDGSKDSFYSAAVEELIAAYKAEYEEKTGTAIEKVVLAGCSNGGYMTMILALRNPEAYTAIVPICEAYMSPEDNMKWLDGIKDMPKFFIFSADDPLVIPEMYERPTLAYLDSIGATNTVVFESENVLLTYEGADPVPAFGHASWVYFFNNTTGETSAWEWIGEQVK